MRSYSIWILIIVFLSLQTANTADLMEKFNYQSDYINMGGEVEEFYLEYFSKEPHVVRLSYDFGRPSDLKVVGDFLVVDHFLIPLPSQLTQKNWEFDLYSITLLHISESEKYGKLYHFSVIDKDIYSLANKPVVKYIYSYEFGIIYFEQLTPLEEDFVFIPYTLISEQGIGAVKKYE